MYRRVHNPDNLTVDVEEGIVQTDSAVMFVEFLPDALVIAVVDHIEVTQNCCFGLTRCS